MLDRSSIVKRKVLTNKNDCRILKTRVAPPGFEPGTLRLAGVRSIQMSYGAINCKRRVGDSNPRQVVRVPASDYKSAPIGLSGNPPHTEKGLVVSATFPFFVF